MHATRTIDDRGGLHATDQSRERVAKFRVQRPHVLSDDTEVDYPALLATNA